MKKKLFILGILLTFIILGGCSKNLETTTYYGLEENWKIELPKDFEQVFEEKNKDLTIGRVTFEQGDQRTLNIMEVTDEDLEVNEALLRDEVEMDHYLHPERYETLDLEGVGRIYGVLIEDTATGRWIMYNKIKIKDRVVSFVMHQKTPFELEEEAAIKQMLSTIEIAD